jgi:hypothetical protein
MTGKSWSIGSIATKVTTNPYASLVVVGFLRVG